MTPLFVQPEPKSHWAHTLTIIFLSAVVLTALAFRGSFSKSSGASLKATQNYLGTVQNDQEGYSGFAWGTQIAEFGRPSARKLTASVHTATSPKGPYDPSADLIKVEDNWNREYSDGNPGVIPQHSYAAITTIASKAAETDAAGYHWISYFKSGVVGVDGLNHRSILFYLPKSEYEWVSDLRYDAPWLYMKVREEAGWSIRVNPVSFRMERGDFEPSTAIDTVPTLKWGSEIPDAGMSSNRGSQKNNRFTDDREYSRMMAAIFGVPERSRSLAGINLNEVDWSDVPEAFQSIKRDDVEYIFYKGRLAMALSHLNAASYGAVKSDLSSKYPQIAEISSSWDLQQLEDNPDREQVKATLYKRGSTNTRIYLIQDITHEGIGMDVTAVFLLYIPNGTFGDIQAEIASRHTAELRAQQTAEKTKAEPDLQKVQ